jgi:hypothetical protein
MEADRTGESESICEASSVIHLSKASRTPLATVLGGGEATKMTPELASNIAVLDEPLLCRMVPDQSEMEINLIDRYLDILAAAELPTTGEEIPVAIENQYGMADPDHFGRLVGWYMPETGAPMGVLIAESFSPQLVKAVNDGVIIRPEHGLWLVEANGYLIGDHPVITYSTVACSLPRVDRIARDRAFHTGSRPASVSQTETKQRAGDLFEYLARTSQGWLGPALRNGRASFRGEYRTIIDNGNTCHVPIFASREQMMVGSCYRKGSWDDEALERLETANQGTTLRPEPAWRALRGVWWDLRPDIGRNTPVTELPPDLGDQIERTLDKLRPAIDAHQAALLAAIKGRDV